MKSDWDRHPIIVIIGIIASCIAIFAFITGIDNIKQFFSSNTNNTDYSSAPNQQSENPDIITEAPTNPPVVIKEPVQTRKYENVTITMQNWGEEQGKGKVRIQWLAGGKPINKKSTGIANASFDILGIPTADWNSTQAEYADVNGVAEYIVEPGEYALLDIRALISGGSFTSLAGIWGEAGQLDDGKKRSMVIFPVQEGMITEVVVHLALLQFGVLNSNGSQALTDACYFILYCQGQDINGNMIPSEACADDVYSNNGRCTNLSGVAEFYVAPGTYFLMDGNYDTVNGLDYEGLIKSEIVINEAKEYYIEVNVPTR